MAAAAATVAAAAPAASRSVCLDSRIADSFTACSTSNAPPSRLALPRNPKQRQGNSQWQQHRNVQHQICAALTADRPFMSRTDEYNRSMQKQMLNPYEYHHELGMYYTHITPNIIVGSQPQSAHDVEILFRDHNVGAILNLQQDKDVQYWGIDINSVVRKCKDLGILHMRKPARDFDANSLRQALPQAVSALDWALSEGRIVYVHCTAGLGRAPAVVIAYLFWFHDMDLPAAYHMVTSKRPCGPKKDAIRGATYDLAKNDPWKAPFEQLPDFAFSGVADWERRLIHERVRSCNFH